MQHPNTYFLADLSCSRLVASRIERSYLVGTQLYVGPVHVAVPLHLLGLGQALQVRGLRNCALVRAQVEAVAHREEEVRLAHRAPRALLPPGRADPGLGRPIGGGTRGRQGQPGLARGEQGRAGPGAKPAPAGAPGQPSAGSVGGGGREGGGAGAGARLKAAAGATEWRPPRPGPGLRLPPS